MQEKFALRKTLKKVAAVGTSLALVGVTISGALAAGLGDLPAPFGNSPATNVVVFGSSADDAAVDDVVAAWGGLPGGASTTVVGGSLGELTLEDFEQGERKDIAVDLAGGIDEAGGFNANALDDTDRVGLVDGEISLNLDGDGDGDAETDENYDYHEELRIGTDAGNEIELDTALDEGDEEFGDNVALTIPEGELQYEVQFEEDLDADNILTGATDDFTATIPFLGKEVVFNAATATSVTAFAGEKFTMKPGDSVVVGDSTVTLIGADAGNAWFDVDGESNTINVDQRKRVGSCEIFVDDTLNSDTDDTNDRAMVYIGCGDNDTPGSEALETYNSGDCFIGEDENECLWEWNLAGLGSTDDATITFAIETHESLTNGDEGDFPDEIMNLGLLKNNREFLADGDYLCLPWRYACLVLEGLDGDITWNEYSFDASNQQEDLDTDNDGVTEIAGADVVEVKATGVGEDRGFTALDVDDGTDSDVGNFDRFWIYWDGGVDVNADGNWDEDDGGALIFYEDRTTGDAFSLSLDDDAILADEDGDGSYEDGAVADSVQLEDVITDGESLEVIRFDNGDYDAIIEIGVEVTDTDLSQVFIHVEDLGNNALDLEWNIEFAEDTADNGALAVATDGLTFFGDADGDDTTEYFCYGATEDENTEDCTADGGTDISGWDVDVMNADGLIVKDPEGKLKSDQVVLSVPDDDEFEYWVRIAKPVGGSTTTTTGSAAASLTMSDVEAGDVLALNKHVAAVGGPCVNAATRALLDLGDDPVCGADSGLEENTGVLELKDLDNGKKGLAVYGWEADDTRRAALVVRNPDQFSAQLEGKNSVTVTGTDLTVSGITVA